MRVYNLLGSGFLEAVYQEALEIELDKRHVPYEKEKELDVYYDGIRLGKKYVADFVYKDKQGNTVVEDSKGYRTKEYLLKKKLFEYKFNLKIMEV